jgi:hypothetical protein
VLNGSLSVSIFIEERIVNILDFEYFQRAQKCHEENQKSRHITLLA